MTPHQLWLEILLLGLAVWVAVRALRVLLRFQRILIEDVLPLVEEARRLELELARLPGDPVIVEARRTLSTRADRLLRRVHRLLFWPLGARLVRADMPVACVGNGRA